MRPNPVSMVKTVGGKWFWRGSILPHFPPLLSDLVAPFFGGGNIETYLAAHGTRVLGGDLYRPVAVLWEWLLRDPARVADLVEAWGDSEEPSREKYIAAVQHFQRLEAAGKDAPSDHLAAAYYIAINVSFNSIPGESGVKPVLTRDQHAPGGWRVKFRTRMKAARMRRWRNANIEEVRHADYEDVLAARPASFAYLDPPYALGSGSRLYGGGLHEAFDHERLRDVLRKRESGWLLSYNDCEEVRSLYAGGWCKVHEITGTYQPGGGVFQPVTELLIEREAPAP